MITTQVTCTECKGIIDSSARSINLPYVCDDCKDAAEFQEKIAPPGNPPAFQKALDNLVAWAGDVAWAGEALPTIDCDTASVENTTLLIDDLEKQIKAKDEEIAYAKETVREYKERCNNLISDFTVSRNTTAYFRHQAQYARHQAQDARQRYRDVLHEKRALKSRGFWARVFNK